MVTRLYLSEFVGPTDNGTSFLAEGEHPRIAEDIDVWVAANGGDGVSWGQYQREITAWHPGYAEGPLVAVAVEGPQGLHDYLLSLGYDDLGAV